jgi:hypothetical protein
VSVRRHMQNPFAVTCLSVALPAMPWGPAGASAVRHELPIMGSADHENRAGRVANALFAHRAEHQSGESTEPARANDEHQGLA